MVQLNHINLLICIQICYDRLTCVLDILRQSTDPQTDSGVVGLGTERTQARTQKYYNRHARLYV